MDHRRPTKPQIAALHLIEQRMHPRPTTPAEVQMLDRLYDLGLITWSLDDPERPKRIASTPRLTPAGREALHPPTIHREQRPVFMTAVPPEAKADYTSDPSRAALQAGEVLETDIVERFARRAKAEQIQRAEREELDRERLSVEDRVAAAREAANHARIDLRDEFRLLRLAKRSGDTPGVVRHLRRIERRTYRRAA